MKKLLFRIFAFFLVLLVTASGKGTALSENAEQSINRAENYLNENQLKSAEIELKNALLKDPKNVKARWLMGKLYMDIGQWEAAEHSLNRAKELLRTTNLKIAEVAYQSGFGDPHYFSTVFKKKTGLTPRQFRDQSKP